MSHSGKLQAWVEPAREGQYRTAFISAGAMPGIRPATRLCASRGEAKQVVEVVAASIAFEVEWTQERAAPGLPKYAPELNDIERSWHDLKARHLARQTFVDTDNLDAAIYQAVGGLNTERMALPLAETRIST